MLKRPIKYTNFNDEEVEEVFYFNLSKPELVEMEIGQEGGMANFLQRIIDEKDNKNLLMMFKDIILKAYGQKSEDGKRFIKNTQLREEFEQTAAFEVLFMELMTEEGKAAEFITGCMPPGFGDDRDQDKPPPPPKIGDTKPASN